MRSPFPLDRYRLPGKLNFRGTDEEARDERDRERERAAVLKVEISVMGRPREARIAIVVLLTDVIAVIYWIRGDESEELETQDA